jgi:hypothetical protein
MARWVRFFTWLAMLLVYTATALAQQGGAAQADAPNHLAVQLDSRIRRVTDDLTKDIPSLPAHQRAILWSQIGGLLWKDDPRGALQMFTSAVEEIENAAKQKSSLNGDRRPERRQLEEAAQFVLQTVGARDRQLSERLLEQLAALSEELREGKDPSAPDGTAEALVGSALHLLEKDAARAAALGSLSLRYGDATRLPYLLDGLRRQNGRLADGLFGEMLRSAQAAQNINRLALLTYAAFPSPYFPSLNLKGEAAPGKWQVSLLQAIAAGVMRDDAEARYCGYATLMAQLLAEVDRLLPQQAGSVRAALTRCEAKSQRVEEALSTTPLKTVDDYLAAAEEAKTLDRRVITLGRAAQLAEQQGDFQKGISILDSLTGEERKFLGDTWELMRQEMVTKAAVSYYTQGDFASMERMIDSTPARTRPFLELELVKRLAHIKKADAAFIRQRLASARQGLSKSEEPGFWPYFHYMAMARLYADVDPQEVVPVIREMVKLVNHAAAGTKSRDRRAEEQAAAAPLKPLEFPAELMETYAEDLVQLISTIEPPVLRAGARLYVLTTLLAHKQRLLDGNKVSGN